MSFEWLWRLGTRAAGARDGSALNLDALAPDLERLGAAEAGPLRAAPGGRGRRDSLEAEVSAKLLGAHLANRHQISYPLTLDFRSLNAEQAGCLVDVASATLAADGEAPPERLARAEERLRRVGADEALLERLREGRGAATALSRLVRQVRAGDVAAHAYAMALLTAEPRSPVSALFLAYLAARLGLTQQVIGSLNRRFRG